ncbi:hypothetical protein JX266_007110 [Neoarthrinium moseri]|nr:hypothetical protein JX266_007110 [Neoarthrinium moseri]
MRLLDTKQRIKVSLLLSQYVGVAFSSAAPEINLDFGSFRGTNELANVDSFLGIPFAQAGRFENPIMVSAANKLEGIQDASKYGFQCPQGATASVPTEGLAELGPVLQAIGLLTARGTPAQDEDCLSINIQAPSGTSAGANLPVLFWIHGGGFSTGASAISSNTTSLSDAVYQGGKLVNFSVEIGQPVIFVSANYRLSLWGFLASQEVTDAGVGNLGLKDQRMALQWVQKCITQFGGDPGKVTLFGESAGSLSAATHMVLNDGDTEGLFRGAIMFSGGALKLRDYSSSQGTFDQVVSDVGCTGSQDPLSCLKNASYSDLAASAQKFPGLISYAGSYNPFLPRPDGDFLKQSPHSSIREGKVADIPYMIGDVEDEGTLFSLVAQLNTTTDDEFVKYFTNTFPEVSTEQLEAFTSLYANLTEESGTQTLGPQYRKLAAAIGDILVSKSCLSHVVTSDVL